jgi:hypothetical protein
MRQQQAAHRVGVMTIPYGRWMQCESKPGNELSPFLDSANDARLQALSRGETASRPLPVFGSSHRWVKRGRRQRGRQAGAGEKGDQGARPRLYLIIQDNSDRWGSFLMRKTA